MFYLVDVLRKATLRYNNNIMFVFTIIRPLYCVGLYPAHATYNFIFCHGHKPKKTEAPPIPLTAQGQPQMKAVG